MLKRQAKKPGWYDFNNYKMTRRMTDYEWLEQLALRLSVRTSDPFCTHEEAPEIRAENIRLIEKYGVVPKVKIKEAKVYYHCLSELEATQKFRGGTGIRKLEIFEMLTIKMYAEKKMEGNAKAIDSRFGEYNRAFISVPLDALDSHLIDQFKLWLKEIRKVKKPAIKKRGHLTWHNCYLLQYLDLSHWKKKMELKFLTARYSDLHQTVKKEERKTYSEKPHLLMQPRQ
jgi:hypothetical protein